MRFDKDFLKLSHKQKLIHIFQNPDYILGLDESMLQEKTIYDMTLLDSLKIIALRRAGYLITSFEEAGLKINQHLVDIAISSCPQMMKEVDKKYLNQKNIHSAIRKDVSLIASIAVEFMIQNMLAYCNRCIRKAVKEQKSAFIKLPKEIQQYNYSATNAYTDKSINILQLNDEQLELNGGKVMFKVARKSPTTLLRMRRSAWRKTLVITMVSTMPEIYAELTKYYRENATVQFATYKALKNQKKEQLIPMLFNEEERLKASKKYKAQLKRKETLKIKEEENSL